jgi:hypothetical protein
MTVKELITMLEKMPPDAEIIYYDGDNGLCSPNVEYCTKILTHRYPTPEYIYGSFVDITAEC